MPNAQRQRPTKPSRATLRRLIVLLAPHRARLLAAVAALVISSALQLAIAPLASGIVNVIQRSAGSGQKRLLFELAAAVLAAVSLRSAFTYAYQCLLNGAVQR